MRYPRTPHLVGSGIPDSGSGKDRLDWSALTGRHVVFEEKIDGSEVSFGFDDIEPFLRFRGNPLDLGARGGREAEFDPLKNWLSNNLESVFDAIEDRHVVYGEWCSTTHRVFYDRLPSLFLEFDIYDNHAESFLSTEPRREIAALLGLHSVPVLFEGVASADAAPASFVARSRFKSDVWLDVARVRLPHLADDVSLARRIDTSDLAEGIYGKIEEDGAVVGRFKWIRRDFVEGIVAGEGHWKDLAPLRNLMGPQDFTPNLRDPSF